VRLQPFRDQRLAGALPGNALVRMRNQSVLGALRRVVRAAFAPPFGVVV
jgi:hypothetical protein